MMLARIEKQDEAEAFNETQELTAGNLPRYPIFAC